MKRRDAILTELDAIQQRHGGVLRPIDVVRFARNPRTVLHGQFTWDDSAAAAQYRLWQARQLIRVTVSLIPGTETESRVFVSMMDDRKLRGGGYRITASMMSDAASRELLLVEALAELEVFRRKYRHLRELAAVFEQIDALPKRSRNRA
jgi:hypothetical protein